ncbi:hypothetical protein SBA2_70007 [Acidobacteriia bacterium SbA2]|nr:hypothetical protein SBA2_70007 [Acidobacteriia bacterium SbA2]
MSCSGVFISQSTTGEGLLRQARTITKLCASPDFKFRKAAKLRLAPAAKRKNNQGK